MEPRTRSNLVSRMVGAAQLSVQTFEDVEADTGATKQAMSVVLIVALATGVGAIGATGFLGLVSGVIVGLVGWASWAWITYFIGTNLFATPGTHANWGQLARTLGFAQSPGVLKVLAIIPGIGGFVFFVVSIWQLVAMVVAVRQALDYDSTMRAVGVVAVGFVPYAILIVFVYALLPA